MNNKMIEKKSLPLVVALAFFLMLCTASALEIFESVEIAGNGTIDRDFKVQSKPGFSGQVIAEYIRPISLDNSPALYRSNFELCLSNNSTIFYEASSKLLNVKHSVASENFELGVCTGFYFIGAQNKNFSFESSPYLSEALVKSEAEGRSVVRARVVNESYYHNRHLDALTWLEGNYTLDWEFLVLKPENPEAGDDDWLACP